LNSRHLVPLFCVFCLGWLGSYKPAEAYAYVDSPLSESVGESYGDRLNQNPEQEQAIATKLSSDLIELSTFSSFASSDSLDADKSALRPAPLDLGKQDNSVASVASVASIAAIEPFADATRFKNWENLADLDNLNQLSDLSELDLAYPANTEELLQAQNWQQWLQLSNVQVVPDGLLLLVNGNAQVNLQRIVGPDRLVIDLARTAIPANLHKAAIPINRYGIRQVRIAQFQKEPAIARIVLDLDPSSNTNWQSSFVPNRGGILLRPTAATTATPSNPTPLPGQPIPVPNTATTRPGNSNLPSIIQGISISNAGQLVIQANQGLAYSGSQDVPSNTYNITVSSARISPQLQRPSISANSPLERIRLTQVGDSVIIGLKVASGWTIRESGRTNPQQIALQLLNAGTVAQNPTPTPALPTPTPSVPTVPNVANRGRGLVVIDPGHGGRDPGAVGNGINEKIIMLPLSQITGTFCNRWAIR
jgi:N-acetylmuramoyl-L-alanine amidase